MDYRIVTSAARTMFGKLSGGVIARLESDQSTNIAEAAGPSISAAKAALLAQLGRLASSTERAYLFCGDGSTVLVVSFLGTSWQYDIIGRDRDYRSGCIMPGVDSFKAAKDRAIAHADQSYGGVARCV